MDAVLAMADFGPGNENMIPIIGIVCGVVVATVAIVCAAVTSQRKTRQREETRRELAAYVAEGSMKADEAERLLKAEPED